MTLMKFLIFPLLILIHITGFSQKSEDLIPATSNSVFSINNVNILQRISLDQLIQYDFMEDIQQELFDGSTNGKTLKDSGIDFDQRFNVFFGKNGKYEISGLTFGVKDENKLFEVFDDFDQIECDYSGVEFYNSYYNHIAIIGELGLLIRVSPDYDYTTNIADSIWMARGNLSMKYEAFYNNQFEKVETIEVSYETEENTSTPIDGNLPEAEENPTEMTFFEILDSVELNLREQFLKEVCDNLFKNKDNLIKRSTIFRNQLTHQTEGIFYINSSALLKRRSFSLLNFLYPPILRNIDELYDNNVLVGDLIVNDQSVDLLFDAKYNEELGQIYTRLTDAKFDKNVLKYIHKDNSTFFTYNINTREAYDEAYKVIIPLLENKDDEESAINLLVFELFNEWINKDALFETYKGSMFGTYSGVKKVKTEKTITHYDEQTFEYTEEIVEAEEDMPIFTLGFTSERPDFTNRIFRIIEKLSKKEVHLEGDYWVIEKGAMKSAPLFILLKNNLLIITNDEDLVKNHAEGYGDFSIEKDLAKKAKNSSFLYAYSDLGKAVEGLPSAIFDDKENALINVLKGKKGQIEISTTNLTQEEASFKMTYSFEGENEDAFIYILDLINSLYINTK